MASGIQNFKSIKPGSAVKPARAGKNKALEIIKTKIEMLGLGQRF